MTWATDRGCRACCHAVSASSGCHAASASEVNYAVMRQIFKPWSNNDKYWCSCSRWHLEFWWYCCSIVIVTAYRLLLVCVYSPLHCTLLPTTDLWQSSGPGPATAGCPALLCRARAVRCRPLVTSPVRGQSPGPGLGSPGQQPRGEMSADCCHHQPRPAKQPSRPTSIFSNHSFHFLSLGSLSSNNTSMIWGSKSMTHS